jgi:hypothetical protein
MWRQIRVFGNKLCGDGCKQQGCVTPVSLASLEEEAGTENSSVGQRLRNRS